MKAMDINYKKEFEELLSSGRKQHTIRTYNMKVGTVLNHVAYPYRPSRRIVLTNTVTCVQSICIDGRKVQIDGHELTEAQIEQLAVNDGFSDVEQFFNYFHKTIRGYIIHWTNKKY